MRFFLTNYFYSLLDQALNQPAMQSSTYTIYEAERAVDGSFLTESLTDYQQDPWWRVDLGSSLPVAEIVVYRISLPVYEIRIGEFRAL